MLGHYLQLFYDFHGRSREGAVRTGGQAIQLVREQDLRSAVSYHAGGLLDRGLPLLRE